MSNVLVQEGGTVTLNDDHLLLLEDTSMSLKNGTQQTGRVVFPLELNTTMSFLDLFSRYMYICIFI